MAGSAYEGEILLCPDVIRHEAKAGGQRYPERLKMLLEHGLIHLLGLDHRTDAQQQVWEKYERQVL
jgi:probable rRNA maturation factor